MSAMTAPNQSKRIAVDLAGMVFAIETASGDCSVLLDERFSRFEATSEPDVVLTVSRDPMPAIFPMEQHRVFEAWDRWGLYSIEGRNVLVERHSFSSAIPERIMILDRDFRRGELFVRSVEHGPRGKGPCPNPLDYPLGHVLMVCLMGRGRGLMVHACGVDHQGRGFLFAGNSGHGKSTMAGLWPGKAMVLSDEHVVLREHGDRFLMYGTPWPGSFGSMSSQRTPLEKVFFLKPGAENTVTRLNSAAASTMLLARSFPPLWDAAAMEYTIGFLGRLTESVTCYELAFLPDENVTDFVLCAK